jgi:hypothetical protein
VNKLKLSETETAYILAALRFAQDEDGLPSEEFLQMPQLEEAGRLCCEQIDELCERLNCGNGEKYFYRLLDEDVQFQAEADLGRRLTEDEMETAKKVFDNTISYATNDSLRLAMEEAIKLNEKRKT